MTSRAQPTPAVRAEPVLPGRLAPAAMYPADDPAIVPRFVRLPSGLRLRVLECGDPNGPPVLLVHGWCCSAFTFRHNLRALADRGCRVVVADLKGHGLSDKPRARGEYTLARMADHVVEVMDAVEMSRGMLVGHSMGGAIAVAVALRHPERVSRLALLAPVGFGTVSLLDVARRITPRVLTPLLPHLLRRWMVAMVLRLAYARDAQITPRDVDEYFAPTQFPSYVRAMRDLLHDFEWSPGRREDLERLAAPTLVLYGTRDLLVWTPSVEALVRAIPQVRFEVIEGAGHVLPEEVPALVNARLAEFVGAPEPGAAFVAAGGTTS